MYTHKTKKKTKKLDISNGYKLPKIIGNNVKIIYLYVTFKKKLIIWSQNWNKNTESKWTETV